MRKFQKLILASLIATLFSSAVYAEKSAQAQEDDFYRDAKISAVLAGVGSLLMSSGLIGYGLPLLNSAMTVGVLFSVEAITSKSDANVKQAKEVIFKEAANYQMTGEMGIVLETAVNCIKAERPELADAEAVDVLIEAIN